jgi:nitrogen fixation protein NifB
MAFFVSLDALDRKTTAAEMRGARKTPRTPEATSPAPSDIAPALWERIKDHPCYSEEAHHYFARMHVAVTPAYNIQCNYCNRKYDCANESRPGVVSETLTPDQAFRKIIAVANEVPQLSVLGIAGPGDACYDWRKTKDTFARVAATIPDLKLCLSTNGLALPDHVDEIADMNIDHVTITINMIDPQIGTEIYPWIFYRNKRYTGIEASTILHERQMLGLDMLAARGVLVKVNSVLIPGINDQHLGAVNAEVKKRGAFLHNIMPLISDPAHGTHFGLTGQRGPTPAELKAVQDACTGGANLMRHCRQCRADAVGLLGEDRGQEFALASLPETIAYDPAKRDAYRAVIARERDDHRQAKHAAAAALHATQSGARVLVAVATQGGGRVNQHFGHAKEFQIYEASAEGVRFIGHRKLDAGYCGGGGDAALDGIIKALAGVEAVLCAKIGECPQDKLRAAGIATSDAWAYDYIETAIGDYYADRYGATQLALGA